ncbi:MAG: hypothetical protein NTX91_02525 [candidate division SR1 bacterium]|nr:hypothetical protein [candidate division SR1 bacterium]
MKIKRLLLLGLVALPFLHGCGFDESIENSQQRDGDDFNVIRDIGPQALDKVFQGNGATTTTQTQTPATASIEVQTATSNNQ